MHQHLVEQVLIVLPVLFHAGPAGLGVLLFLFLALLRFRRRPVLPLLVPGQEHDGHEPGQPDVGRQPRVLRYRRVHASPPLVRLLSYAFAMTTVR